MEASEVDTLTLGVHEGPVAIVFFEGGPMPLSESVMVREFTNGPHDGDSGPTRTVQAGTQVCSWALHFDPEQKGVSYTITVDFGQTIIGAAPTRDSRFLEVPGIDYTGGSRYPKQIGGTDSIDISGTRMTAVLTDGDADGMRILTSC